MVEFGQRLKKLLRESDTLVRWGGEEFLIMTRETDPADAGILAQRILSASNSKPFSVGGKQLQVTCSIGFCCFPFLTGRPHQFGWEQVVNISDQAMYLCKARGRNRAIGVLPRKPALGSTESELILSDLDTAESAGLVSFSEIHQ